MRSAPTDGHGNAASLVTEGQWTQAWNAESAERAAASGTSQAEPTLRGLDGVLAGVAASARRCVEIGAAGGKTQLWLRDAFPQAQIVGLDYSLPGLALARRTAAGARRPVPGLVAARFEAPPFRPGAFDLAASFGLLEHFTGQAQVDCLRSHADLVRPGGHVLVTVPHRHALVYRAYHRAGDFACHRVPALGRALGINFVQEEPLSVRDLFRLSEAIGLRRPRVFESDGAADLWRITVERLAGKRRRAPARWREIDPRSDSARHPRGRTLALLALAP